MLHADLSADLLVTIFMPRTALHDGAVIVRGEQIVAAGALLPLAETTVQVERLGTRHRAALGIAERTDAIVVVVSEESGQVSLVERSRIRRNLNEGQLARAIVQLLLPGESGRSLVKRGTGAVRSVTAVRPQRPRGRPRRGAGGVPDGPAPDVGAGDGPAAVPADEAPIALAQAAPTQAPATPVQAAPIPLRRRRSGRPTGARWPRPTVHRDPPSRHPSADETRLRPRRPELAAQARRDPAGHVPVRRARPVPERPGLAGQHPDRAQAADVGGPARATCRRSRTSATSRRPRSPSGSPATASGPRSTSPRRPRPRTTRSSPSRSTCGTTIRG